MTRIGFITDIHADVAALEDAVPIVSIEDVPDPAR